MAHAFLDSCKTSTLFITEQGFIGIGPRSIRPGDRLAVLLGSNAPVLLRPGRTVGHSELLDLCFVAEIIRGELILQLNAGQRTLEWFKLA